MIYGIKIKAALSYTNLLSKVILCAASRKMFLFAPPSPCDHFIMFDFAACARNKCRLYRFLNKEIKILLVE